MNKNCVNAVMLLSLVCCSSVAMAQDLDCEQIKSDTGDAYARSVAMKEKGAEESDKKKKQQMMRQSSSALGSAADLATLFDVFCNLPIKQDTATTDASPIEIKMQNAKNLCLKLGIEDSSDKLSTCVLTVILE